MLDIIANQRAYIQKKDKEASVRKCGRNVKRRLRYLLKIILVLHITEGFSYPFVSVYWKIVIVGEWRSVQIILEWDYINLAGDFVQ